MPTVLNYKWEKLTGVPDAVVVRTYMSVYRKRSGSKSPDALKGDKLEMERFRQLLTRVSPAYAGAPEWELGQQLIQLRKAGKIKWGTGRPGPRKGYKERALEAVAEAVRKAGLSETKALWVVNYVREAMRPR